MMKRALIVYVLAGALATGMVMGHAMANNPDVWNKVSFPKFLAMYAAWPFTTTMYFTGVASMPELCRTVGEPRPKRYEERI